MILTQQKGRLAAFSETSEEKTRQEIKQGKYLDKAI